MKKSLFTVTTVVLICIVLEIIVRAGLFIFPESDLRRVILLWHQQGIMTAYNEAASYVRFIPNRQSPDITADGFHSPEIPFEKPEGVRRLAFIGGSTTFDSGPVNQTYPHLVNEYLRRKGLETDYINAGVGAYTSTESLINYHLRVRPWKPDLVVFYNARNDLLVSGNSLYSPRDMTRMIQPPYYEAPPKPHRSLSRISLLYALTMELIGVHSFRNNNWDWKSRHDDARAEGYGRPETMDEFMENIETERVLQVYRRNVEALAAITERSGAHLLLVGYDFHPGKLKSVSLPNDREPTAGEREFMLRCILEMNRILEETAGLFLHVHFFDLYGKIDRSHFHDDCHLSLAGKAKKTKLIGGFIYENSDELGW